MKRNTIALKIFKFNIVLIIMLIILVSLIFNVAVTIYIKNDILSQLQKISQVAEDVALSQGPGFMQNLKPKASMQDNFRSNNIHKYYFMIDRALREPLSVLNANFILLDNNKTIITPLREDYFSNSNKLINQICEKVSNKLENLKHETYMNFRIDDNDYIALIKSVSNKNNFGLGFIVIYSSLNKVNQLQFVINIILLSILLFSAVVTIIFSLHISKKISAPFKILNEHIRNIAKREFGTKIEIPVVYELKEFIDNINIMSEKLEIHDKAQKTFLQNASHEFRTPLMSIQSYAEGIKYDVVEKNAAIDIIIDESKRLTHLFEDLLYLSRLDSIEENYHFENLNFAELIDSCAERLNGIALKYNVKILINKPGDTVQIYADEEMLSRAIINIVSNCLRYAKSKVEIDLKIQKDQLKLVISDDGSGFDEKELPNLFDRFYKGKKGNFGLGLAITKSIIEKHNGTISAKNTENGAEFRITLGVF